MITLNSKLLISLIHDEIDKLKSEPVGSFEVEFNKKMKLIELQKQSDILLTRINEFELLQKHGDEWFGTARSFIQSNFINGSDVTWGSFDQLNPRGGLSVYDIESLAASVSSTAINEFKKI